jgi:hypothetical protein
MKIVPWITFKKLKNRGFFSNNYMMEFKKIKITAVRSSTKNNIMIKILTDFANDFINCGKKRLVPNLPIPSNHSLCYQDFQLNSLCYQYFQFTEKKSFVVFDIFKNNDLFETNCYAMNLRYLDNEDKIAFATYNNINIIQVFDLIAIYDGHGSWETRCGSLVGYLCFCNLNNNAYNKLQKTANFNDTEKFLELNQENEIVMEFIKKYIWHLKTKLTRKRNKKSRLKKRIYYY